MSIPHKLSLQDFLLSLTLAPRVVIELLVENKHGEILLLRRDIPPFIDTWHLPGGFLLKDELIRDCVNRLLKEELGSSRSSWEFIKLVEDIDGDPRGHLLHYFVRVKLDDLKTTKTANYFKRLPSNTMPHQIPMLLDLGYQITT